MNLLRRFVRDVGGSAAVEFAIIAPFLMVFGTLGYAGVVLHAGAVSLETGAAAAARWAILGVDPVDPGTCRASVTTRTDMIRCIVERHVCPTSSTFCYWDTSWLAEGDDGVIAPLRLEMRTFADARNVGRAEPFTDTNNNGQRDNGESYVDVNGNGIWDTNTWAVSEGGSGEHVVYTLTMAQKVLHPLLMPVMGTRLLHEARLVVRNEPF